MPIQVKTPDGNIAQFPDGMSDEQISAVLAKEFPAPRATKPAVEPSGTFSDVLKSAGTGLVKGITGIIGAAPDVADVIGNGLESIGLPGRDPKAVADLRLLGSGNINRRLTQGGVPLHEPQTTAGKYAEAIASFAPAAAVPGSAAARVARVALPAVASETAGELTSGSGLEPYARVAGAVAGGIAAGPAIRSINSVTSRAFNAPIVDPNVAARELLSGAVQRDGGINAINQNLQNYRGISNPALIDVAGNNVRRIVRSAASGGSGEAQNIATTYADRIAGNLQDNAMQLTRRLTPVTNSADDYGNLLADLQRDDARFNYAGPYSEPATVTREMVSALQGPEGRGAINRAYAAARANRDQQQMAELQDLRGVASEQGGGRDPITGRVRSIQDALGELSAGSLDRVRIAMRETGNSLAARGARDTARGYAGRVRDIDTALDQTPGLRDARASYADYARQQEALELGRTGLNASPETYGATIQDLAARSPMATQAAGVGYRQALTDAIQRPAEGATGVLNRIATSGTQTRNLSATFGPQAATDYQTGVGNEIDRLRNARFISPNTGSQTQLRLQDSGLVDIPTNAVGLLGRIWDHIRRGGTLTEQERAALVRMGTTEASVRSLAQANPSLSSRALTSALLGNETGNRQ